MGGRYGCTCSTDYLTLNGYGDGDGGGGSVRFEFAELEGIGERLSRGKA